MKLTSVIKRIRNFSMLIFLMFFIGTGSVTMTSCAKKVGCAVNDNVGPKTNRDGSLSMKRGKSGLLSKKQRRKKRKRN